jgi:hypothetical protein
MIHPMPTHPSRHGCACGMRLCYNPQGDALPTANTYLLNDGISIMSELSASDGPREMFRIKSRESSRAGKLMSGGTRVSIGTSRAFICETWFSGFRV